jgi:predicted transposase YbfD/YdcC
MDCTTESSDVHEIEESQIRSLYELLREVPDQRHKRGRRYEAATVLVLLILAKMAGERTLIGVADWVRHRRAWLQPLFQLKQLPCANTYSNVCVHLEIGAVNEKVGQWLDQVTPTREGQGWVHWAIDGKVLRGSHHQTPMVQSGQEVLNVYDVESGRLQHCQMIASKGYEAATAQAFVERTDCTGVLITADALHTRPRFCQRIRQQNGHYLLIVKRNRAYLEAEIRQALALPPDPAFPVERAQTVETTRGRFVTRRLSTTTELNLALADEWRDIAQVFVLDRFGLRNGKPFCESVCGLTSLTPAQASPAQLLALVQAHWRIENRCHWRRDATLGEDACTVRQSHVATLLAVLNSAILALFDHCRFTNARSAIRTFAAWPERALAFLLQPL